MRRKAQQGGWEGWDGCDNTDYLEVGRHDVRMGSVEGML